MTVHVAKDPPMWVENSITFDTGMMTTDFEILTYMVIAAAIFILCHSYQVHKGSSYSSIRIQAEVSALAALFAAIFYLICKDNPNPTKSAVLADFFANGLFNVLILLCDGYMFYYRLCAVIKVPKRKKILVHFYLWFLVILPWFPAYNIAPIFVDANDDQFYRVYFINSSCVSATIILYNILITTEFTKILLAIYLPGLARSSKTTPIPIIAHTHNTHSSTDTSSSLSKIRIVAIKSLGHCITSCTAVVCYTAVPVYGPTLQSLILIIGKN